MAGLMSLTDSPSTVLLLADTGSVVAVDNSAAGNITLGDVGIAITLGDLP
jgi:hypothetical protein